MWRNASSATIGVRVDVGNLCAMWRNTVETASGVSVDAITTATSIWAFPAHRSATVFWWIRISTGMCTAVSWVIVRVVWWLCARVIVV